ncbi:MAG: hypothetical protein ACE5HZ_03305, partial [Fidelibacterota bacterium]
LKFSGLILGVRLLDTINTWPDAISRFLTSQPFATQILVTLAFSVVGALFLSVALGLIIAYTHSQEKGSTPRPRTNIPPFLWGIALGAAVAGISAAVSALTPSLAPRWPSYAPASAYIPLLGMGLESLTKTLVYTTLFLLIFLAAHQFTQNWTRRKTVTGLLWIFMGIVISGSLDLTTVPQWIVASLITGAVLFLAYWLVFRYALFLVPLAVGTLMIMGDIREALLQPYLAAIPGVVFSALGVGLVSYGWSKTLKS